MGAVTIARQLGSGGEEIAAIVARTLGARLLDQDLLVLASEGSGIPLHYLQSLDERSRGMLRRPIDLVRLVPLPPINPDLPDVIGDRYPPTGPIVARGEGLVSPAYWASEAYAALLARTMRAEAEAGEVVVVGRAGNEALSDLPGTLHVLITSSELSRVERLMRAEGLDAFDALERVRASDAERRRYVRQFYGADWLDPGRYDLVVDTDKLSHAAAADVICAAARAVSAAKSAPAGQPQAAVA
jgi:cytidylate kinase